MSADKLMQEAESLLNKGARGFSFFGSNSEKIEDAVEKFKEAGNEYRRANDGKKAGQAYERAADIQATQLKEPLDSARSLEEAFRCYREVSLDDAVRVMQQCILMFDSKSSDSGRTARLQKDLANTYERMENNPKAIEAYQAAIRSYNHANNPASANGMREKAGILLASEKKYREASELFFESAKAVKEGTNPMIFLVKEWLFKAGICQMAIGDVVGMKKALDEYENQYRGFNDEPEGRLFRDLLEALEAQDADRVAQIAADWDRTRKFKDWMIAPLLEVKKIAEGGEEDFS